MADITSILKQRIMILDGAMGTMIQRYDLLEKDFRNKQLEDHPKPLFGNNDLLSITRPDIIREIHSAYFKAGADIVETNTFSSTSIAQMDYGLEDDEWVYQLNYQSARIAKSVAEEFTGIQPDKPRYVADSIGPTNRTASLSPDVNDPGYRAVSFEGLKNAYALQIKGLVEGGVDLLLVETVFDTLNAKAALFAIEEYKTQTNRKVPVMVSGTITDASGRTLSGQTTEAFLISISHVPLLSVGLNCALGADQLRPYVQIMSKNSDVFVSAHPNAGLPNEFGQYDQTAEEMGELIKEYLEMNLVNIVGGCCGTTPEHISVMAEIAKNYKPRTIN
ncbi:MAG: 5-methyltetrahydrofolate--homocysteine methyltransferase [Cyclobacteriaceae bacterium]|jgi:5-methyltetrahydrofolate--homocysteine methyltransferase